MDTGPRTGQHALLGGFPVLSRHTASPAPGPRQCPPCLTSPRSEGLEALTLWSCCSMSPRWQSAASLVSRTTGSSFSRGRSGMGFSVPGKKVDMVISWAQKQQVGQGMGPLTMAGTRPRRKTLLAATALGKLSQCRLSAPRTGTWHPVAPPGPGQALQDTQCQRLRPLTNPAGLRETPAAQTPALSQELKMSSVARKMGSSVNLTNRMS